MNKNDKLFEAFTAFLNDFKDEVAQQVYSELSKQLSKQQQKPLFYNLKQVEQLTGITYLALKGRIKRGTLKTAKEGNIHLVSAKEFDRLIEKIENSKRNC